MPWLQSEFGHRGAVNVYLIRDADGKEFWDAVTSPQTTIYLRGVDADGVEHTFHDRAVNARDWAKRIGFTVVIETVWFDLPEEEMPPTEEEM